MLTSLARRVLRARRRGAAVSVVVTVTDANVALLSRCLGALAAQARRPEQVELVLTGDAGWTRQAAAAEEARSLRVRVHPGAGAASAADQVARAARTTFVWLLDAGDVPEPGALAELADALSGSGSPVAVGGASRVGRGVAATLVDAFPASTGHALWRRPAYAAVVDEADGLGPVAGGPLRAARRVVAAATVDLCTTRVLAPGSGQAGAAFGTLPVLAPELDRFVPAVRLLLDEAGSAGRGVRTAVLRWLLTTELPRWWADVERCDAAGFTLLSDLAADLWRDAGEVADEVPVPARVAWWLAAHRRRDDLEALTARTWSTEGPVASHWDGTRARALLGVEDLPEDLTDLTEAETPLQARVRRVAQGDGSLTVDLVCWVRGLALPPGTAPGLTVQVRGGDRTPRPAQVHLLPAGEQDPEVDEVAGEPWHQHRWARVHVVVPDQGPAGPLDLDVTLTVPGLARRTTVRLPAARRPRGDTDLVDGLAARGDRLMLTPAGAGGIAAGPGVALTSDPWGLGTRPLPPGRYPLSGFDGQVAVVASPGLLATGPSLLRSASHRVRLLTGASGELDLLLGPPLREDEVGRSAQQRLQAAYAVDPAPVDPATVYLQSYVGQGATDSPRAIHEALRRRRPDLVLRWGVRDLSVHLPEGAEPVLIGSREWYSVLATSGSVVVNADLEPWWVRRPGQRVLQTFHGYPSKAMGLAVWRAKNWSPRRIERQLARTSGTWDLLLTPTEEMVEPYRREYRYDGPVHSAGYPRNDGLTGPDAERRRTEVRHRLGIGDRTAVLYAPTWRDDLATHHRRAAMSSDFDLEAASAALGEDHVLLLRGHRFHRDRPPAGGSVLDVTDHPEVNDLVLASDAAVLDYSSLRFDYALTGRPMVFLVPDLERYTEGVRGFLHDFADTAPGPRVRSTDEVVAALRDLDGVRRTWAVDYARFNARFNPHQDGHAAERVVEAFFGTSR